MSPTFQKNDLMSVLESIADAVVKLDGRANYMAMNRAAAEIFRRLGRDPEQIIGKSVWQVLPTNAHVGTLFGKSSKKIFLYGMIFIIRKTSAGTKHKGIPLHQERF